MKAQILMVSALLAGPVSAGPWTDSGYIATAEPSPHGIYLDVYYSPDDGCDVARMGIVGNPDIAIVVLGVDDELIGNAESTYLDENVAVFMLSDLAVRKLKAGKVAVIITDQGRMVVSLEGSRLAIDRARIACQRDLKESNDPLPAIGHEI